MTPETPAPADLARLLLDYGLSEHQHQAALIGWADIQARIPAYGDLALLFAIPNGGKRGKVTAALLKAEGVRPGVPDLCLPVARGRHHGLYIELKVDGGRPSQEQLAWLAALLGQGYRAVVCEGWRHARDVLLEYIEERA